MNKHLSIIVAVSSNNAIGKGNDLLFHIPGDLKRFKEITSGHTIIMGRKTYDSLPRKPLPNRRNIIISRNTNLEYPGAEVVNSLETAITRTANKDEVFVIGGGEIYAQALPHCNKLYITEVDRVVDDADVFFPQVNYDDWETLSCEVSPAGTKAEFSFKYVNYKRK